MPVSVLFALLIKNFTNDYRDGNGLSQQIGSALLQRKNATSRIRLEVD